MVGALRRLFTKDLSAEPVVFATFLGRQAAFVAQKSVLDYCRVKAGRQESLIFADPAFQAALLHCRWQTFAASAQDLVALAEAWLRPHALGREAQLAAALARLGHTALTADPPPHEELETIGTATASLPQHLAMLQREPPHTAPTLPLLAETPLLATLPIHPEQRRGETPAIRGALRFLVVSAQQEMERGFAPNKLAGRLMET